MAEGGGLCTGGLVEDPPPGPGAAEGGGDVASRQSAEVLTEDQSN